MKTLGVVPARFASSRLPGKMLKDLGGLPVVVRTAQQACKASSLDEILVATDHPDIENAVKQAGINVVMTRPDHPSGTDRIAEAVEQVEAELIVNIQGDEPFVDPATLNALVARMKQTDCPDMGTASTPILTEEELHEPSVVKVVADSSGRAMYFSRSLIPHCRDASPATLLSTGLYQRHLGLYAYRKTFLKAWKDLVPHPLEDTEKLEQLRALANGFSIAVIQVDQTAPGIDTLEDLEAARARFRVPPSSDPLTSPLS